MSKFDIYKIKKGRRTYHKCNKILFDSKPEALHYIYFMEHPNIEVIEIHKTFKLLDKFKYYCIDKKKNRTMREMVYTPDFIIKLKGHPKLISVEVKGLARKDYMIRKKLFIAQYKHIYDFVELKGTVKIPDARRIFDEFY